MGLAGGLMARMVEDSRLGNRTQRAKLKVQKEPYWLPMEEGRSLGYYKGVRGGKWLARYYDALAKPSKRYQPLGSADDYSDPDGVTVLSFSQAQAAARAWFLVAHEDATGVAVTPKGKPATVADAVALYLEDRKRQGAKTADRMGYDFNAHVLPMLGEVALAHLTRKRIEDWMAQVAASPVRRRGKETAAPETAEAKQSRKNTANRLWKSFKAALNLAFREKLIHSQSGWAGVKNFKGVDEARIRFFSPAEQVRFVNACPAPDFRRLVKAGLFTGAREGELVRLVARDFDSERGTVFIEFSKSGKSRHVELTEEAREFFQEVCAGLKPTDPIFTRTHYERKDKKSTGTWSRAELSRMMRDTCEAAGLEPLIFHELRHTYASGLVNGGVPLVFVAAQLGHRDTRMVEKHYGHLCQSAKRDTVRKLAPVLGIGEAPKVAELEIQGA